MPMVQWAYQTTKAQGVVRNQVQKMSGATQKIDQQPQENDTPKNIVQYALSIPEVRAGVRRRLQAQGKLPSFTPEQAAALIDAYNAESSTPTK